MSYILIPFLPMTMQKATPWSICPALPRGGLWDVLTNILNWYMYIINVSFIASSLIVLKRDLFVDRDDSLTS